MLSRSSIDWSKDNDQREELDPTLTKVSKRYSTLGFKSAIICDVHIKIRIETSLFCGILGAMGLAVGLSLQGSLLTYREECYILF
jgi:small conductance mechanosensitive channel